MIGYWLIGNIFLEPNWPIIINHWKIWREILTVSNFKIELTNGFVRKSTDPANHHSTNLPRPKWSPLVTP